MNMTENCQLQLVIQFWMDVLMYNGNLDCCTHALAMRRHMISTSLNAPPAQQADKVIIFMQMPL